jgi:hypothetical protein
MKGIEVMEKPFIRIALSKWNHSKFRDSKLVNHTDPWIPRIRKFDNDNYLSFKCRFHEHSFKMNYLIVEQQQQSTSSVLLPCTMVWKKIYTFWQCFALPSSKCSASQHTCCNPEMIPVFRVLKTISKKKKK